MWVALRGRYGGVFCVGVISRMVRVGSGARRVDLWAGSFTGGQPWGL